MRAFVDFPHRLEPDRNYVVATTRFTVRSPRTAWTFLARLGPVDSQIRAHDGMVAFGLRPQILRMSFSTFAVFESRRALADFVLAEVHGAAMDALRGRLHHVEARTLRLPGAEIPRDWPAIGRMRTETAEPTRPITSAKRRVAT